MTLPESISLFLISAAAVWASGFVVCKMLARLGMIDVPNDRSSHDRPTVRGGGVSILLVTLVWLLMQLGSPEYGGWALIVGLLMVGGVSFFDDFRSLPLSWRLCVHGLAAAIFVSAAATSPVLSMGALGVGTLVLIWFLIVGYTNAFNFLDGLNGLAGSQAILSCLFGALFCALAGDLSNPAVQGIICLLLVLGGAAAGFLPHNFPKARMFLGDVGSISIGFTLAATVFLAWEFVGWQAAVALAALQINVVMDTSVTVLRRALRGARLHMPHREFFFHRLNRSGLSHAQVTGIQTGLQLLAGIALAIAVGHSATVLLSVVGYIFASWILFFVFCERRFQGSEAIDRTKVNAGCDL